LEKNSRGAVGRPITIAVVDDHRFMRQLITGMLARQKGRYKVVAECEDVKTALVACRELTPDLLILDINLPGDSGIEAVAAVKQVSPQTRILLCTAFVTDERILEALRSGTHGFVEKTNSWEDFVEAIQRVAAGEHFFCARSSAALAHFSQNPPPESPAPAAGLSPREKEVLKLVAHGSSSKEVAQKLGISVGTIDVHRANLMKKLRVKNIAGLVIHAFTAGLIG
jgi:DNA-binding NarL/FixJ family response regulator